MLQGNSSRRVSRYSRITHTRGEVIQVRVHQGNLPERRIIHLAINGREEYTDGYLLRNSGRAASSLPHLTGWFVSLGSRFHGCGKHLRAEPPGTTARALTPPPKTIFPETQAAVPLNTTKAQTERIGPVLSFIPFLREGFFSPTGSPVQPPPRAKSSGCAAKGGGQETAETRSWDRFLQWQLAHILFNRC